LYDRFLIPLFKDLGIYKPPPGSPPTVCKDQMGDPITFLIDDKNENRVYDEDEDDQFYATGIDTDQRFYIAGRSTFMDRTMDRSPPNLSACITTAEGF
jgi:hypothetical protein